MKRKPVKQPTLDQVIRDAVNVQSRILKETGALIEFHFTFRPADDQKKPKAKP